MTESKADELRRLVQAVVDAWDALDRANPARAGFRMHNALDRAVSAAGFTAHESRVILAALDDAVAQGRAAGDVEGYARAMREVAEFGDSDPCPICKIAEWARARAEVPRG